MYDPSFCKYRTHSSICFSFSVTRLAGLILVLSIAFKLANRFHEHVNLRYGLDSDGSLSIDRVRRSIEVLID